MSNANPFGDLLSELGVDEVSTEIPQPVTTGEPAAEVQAEEVQEQEPTQGEIEATEGLESIGMMGEGEDQEALAEFVRNNTVAIRFASTKFNPYKGLDTSQNEKSAKAHNAKSDKIKSKKQLIDTKNAHFKKSNSVISEAYTYWVWNTVPFTDVGVRLIRLEDLKEFESKIAGYRAELAKSVNGLNGQRAALIDGAKKDLGDVFSESDYPASFVGKFTLSYSVFQIEPPKHLQKLHPEVYKQQVEMMKRRFESSIALMENEFAKRFEDCVGKIVERMGVTEDGKAKTFKDSTIENMNDFFDRFTKLNFTGETTLTKLVEDAKKALKGIKPAELRKNASQRQNLKESMEKLKTSLSSMMVEAPIRKARLAD